MIELLIRINYKPAVLAFFALACLVLASVITTRAQTTQSPLPPPTGYVNDYAEVIDAATEQRMENILVNLKQRANIEFAVVTVNTTGGQDIFDYSLAVARGWGIGPGKEGSKGMLLLVAIQDRKYFTQVSRHLEGDLPDGLTGEIGRRMREPFRAGDYSAGLMTAVQTLVATLAEKQGFSIEGIDQNYAYRGRTQAAPRGRRSSGGISPCVILFIIAIILLFLLASRGRGGGGSGCLNLLLLNALLNSGRSSGGWSSSGWSGGGFGGSGGGGGGGFGGFGGGGDFGGGGSGGSW